jgi:hypothetical protein
MTLKEIADGLEQYVMCNGAEHDSDCPGDDTCKCSWMPMNDAANAACRVIRKLASQTPDHAETCPFGRDAECECLADALARLGNIINDAPYRLEEREGAWQGFLQNKQDILKCVEVERQRNVQRWHEQDQIIRDLREELRITVAALKLELQSANVSGATRSDSVVAEGVTLPVGEKPALTCHNGMPHYCPNCDRSFDDIFAAENRRTKRSTREDGGK